MQKARAAEKRIMRKFTVLLAVAVLAASSTGCCCGKIRNWFHKGSPCGTSVAPAVLGAPLAMGTPMTFPTSAPMAPAMCVQAQPQCCVPCNPCCDPCDPCASGQMTTGYLGGFTSGGDCNCSGGGMMMSGEQIMVSPQPLSDVQ
jgi:hypothetical protein